MGMGSNLPSAVTSRGHRVARGLLRACLVVVALACLVGATQGCDPIREGVMRVTPGVPDPSGCAEGTQRCAGAVPEVCSASHRWWPALPRRADGTQRACSGGCGVTDAGVAVCVAVDASVAADSDGGVQ